MVGRASGGGTASERGPERLCKCRVKSVGLADGLPRSDGNGIHSSSPSQLPPTLSLNGAHYLEAICEAKTVSSQKTFKAAIMHKMLQGIARTNKGENIY